MGSCSASEIELKSTLDNTTACLIMTGTNKYNIDPIIPKIINIVSSAAIDFPILNLTSFNLIRKNVIIG
jgi:hypothetical protein